ncbi:MAG: intradiol ring-cleavage dioxygenase [Marinoscillum sp.]
MRQEFILLLSTILFSYCSSGQKPATPVLIGGPCEGCEAILEYGDRALSSVDTLPGFGAEGQMIKVSGTIYKPDGKTPASGVILYVYHTDQNGLYTPDENTKGWGRRHGYLRGWVKTDASGYYTFYTLMPAGYPNRPDPSHIHYTILEPNGKYYYLESCLFEGDPRLTDQDRNPVSPRGGAGGLMKMKTRDDLMVGTRNVILGKNVPGYE